MQACQKEIGKVVDRERHFQAVRGLFALEPHAAGVVDQDVKTWMALVELVSQRADLALRGHVCQEKVYLTVAGVALDFCNNGSGLDGVASHENHVSALPGQLAGGD